jgi:hypothetical protein
VDRKARIHLWFKNDGAPPNFHLAVREFLNNVFPEQWIRVSEPSACPAPSAVLNLFDSNLWVYLKSTAYAKEVGDVRDLQQQTHNGFQTTQMTPGIFQRRRQLLSTRAKSCLKLMMDTEHIFFNPQEAVTQKICFRRPTFIHFLFLYCAAD